MGEKDIELECIINEQVKIDVPTANQQMIHKLRKHLPVLINNPLFAPLWCQNLRMVNTFIQLKEQIICQL